MTLARDTGTAGQLQIQIPDAPLVPTDGYACVVLTRVANVWAYGASGHVVSTPATCALNGWGALPILRDDAQPLLPGDLAGGGAPASLIYDATIPAWRLLNPSRGRIYRLVIPWVYDAALAASDQSYDTDDARANLYLPVPFDVAAVDVYATQDNAVGSACGALPTDPTLFHGNPSLSGSAWSVVSYPPYAGTTVTNFVRSQAAALIYVSSSAALLMQIASVGPGQIRLAFEQMGQPTGLVRGFLVVTH